MAKPTPAPDDTEARRLKGQELISLELERLGLHPQSPEAFAFWRSLGYAGLDDWRDSELDKLRQLYKFLCRLQPNSVRLRVPEGAATVPRYDLLQALTAAFEALRSDLIRRRVIEPGDWAGILSEIAKIQSQKQ